MAKNAVAREIVFALRRQIAKIEGTLPECLGAPAGADITVVRRSGMAEGGALTTGVSRFDAALGGGLPKAALSEIHSLETRDAGAVAGFVLALASLALGEAHRADGVAAPILWIGTTEIYGEAGFPYARGLQALCGIGPGSLLFCEARKLTDALWIAEEAARLPTPAAIVLEIHGNPRRLDLTATRRLHARAQQTGRPLLLLRQAALAEPTAAPVRLVVAAAPSGLRQTVAGPLAGSIGQPAFTVSIGKSAHAVNGQFILEWNPDERIFQERSAGKGRAKNPFPVVSLPRYGTGSAAAAGEVVAFKPGISRQGGQSAAGDQPPRPQRAAHSCTRRTG